MSIFLPVWSCYRGACRLENYKKSYWCWLVSWSAADQPQWPQPGRQDFHLITFQTVTVPLQNSRSVSCPPTGLACARPASALSYFHCDLRIVTVSSLSSSSAEDSLSLLEKAQPWYVNGENSGGNTMWSSLPLTRCEMLNFALTALHF